jgi:hypothetical protein
MSLVIEEDTTLTTLLEGRIRDEVGRRQGDAIDLSILILES